MKPLLTIKEVKEKLITGSTIEDLFDLRDGQECTIFKAPDFLEDENDFDKVIYIPDLELNAIPIDQTVWPSEIEEVLSYCYTAKDFMDECGGDRILAVELFRYCDWQNPSSALPEVEDELEDESEDQVVIEFCPECENEIEMKWDVSRLGYKAFCPICGSRLMLCDRCQHDKNDKYLGDCDYCSDTDQCRHNKS